MDEEGECSQSVSPGRKSGYLCSLRKLGWLQWDGVGGGGVFLRCAVPLVFSYGKIILFFAWWLPNCLAVGAGDSGVGVGVGDFFVCVCVLFTPPLLPLPLFAVGGSYFRRPPFLCGDGSREGVHFVVCQRTYKT